MMRSAARIALTGAVLGLVPSWGAAQIPVATGRDVFTRAGDGDLIHFNWTESTGWQHENVSDQVPAGLSIDSAPSPVYSLAPGLVSRADVFSRNGDGHLIHHWWVPPTNWQGEDLTSGNRPLLVGDPVPVSSEQNGWMRHDVFARGEGGALVHYWWSLQPPSGWHAETIAGLPIDGPPDVLVSYQGGLRHDVFARDAFNELIHYWWTASTGWNSESLTNGMSSRRIFSDPEAIVSYQDGRLRHDVFARGSSGLVRHFWWLDAPPANWNHGVLNGPFTVGKPDAIVSNQGGYLRHDVFARDSSNRLVHWWWSALPPSGWQVEVPSELTMVTNPVAVSERQGRWMRYDVFGRNSSNQLVHYWWSEEPPAVGGSGVVSGPAITGEVDVRAGWFTGELRQDIFARNTGGDVIHYWWSEVPPAVGGSANLTTLLAAPGTIRKPAGMKGRFDYSDE
jgi:hypothetical protein